MRTEYEKLTEKIINDICKEGKGYYYFMRLNDYLKKKGYKQLTRSNFYKKRRNKKFTLNEMSILSKFYPCKINNQFK